LQPAEVDQVLLCDMLGRAIVLVREDQLSLAIGRRGQNVRLASKLCGWDIEIMTADELDEQIDRASAGFMSLEGMNEELATRLVEQGYLSYDDLSVIEPSALVQMGGLTEEQVEHLVEQAERKAEEAERAASEERRRQKDQEKLEAADAAAADPAVADPAVADPAAADPAAADGGAEPKPMEEAPEGGPSVSDGSGSSQEAG
jgi:N utilization substance protein A